MQEYIKIQPAKSQVGEWPKEWQRRAQDLRLRREAEVEEKLYSMSLRGLLDRQFHKIFHHHRHIDVGV